MNPFSLFLFLFLCALPLLYLYSFPLSLSFLFFLFIIFSKKWSVIRKAVAWSPFVQVYRKKYPWVQLAGHQGMYAHTVLQCLYLGERGSVFMYLYVCEDVVGGNCSCNRKSHLLRSFLYMCLLVLSDRQLCLSPWTVISH